MNTNAPNSSTSLPTEPRPPAFERTADELALLLAAMSVAAKTFYSLATRAEFHQFVEFAGFLNKFVELCDAQAQAGKDFTTNPLDIEPHDAAYLGEKFGCIFGTSFTVEHIAAFLRTAFGPEILLEVFFRPAAQTAPVKVVQLPAEMTIHATQGILVNGERSTLPVTIRAGDVLQAIHPSPSSAADFAAARAQPRIPGGCDHKFIDSVCCVKCGWDPSSP